MHKTINEILVVMKVVRERITDLKGLREQVATQTRYYGNAEKAVTPEYDVKLVDKKITELQNWCALVDAKIKMSNAVTTVELELNMETLLAPLE
jgi:hypothetical protein